MLPIYFALIRCSLHVDQVRNTRTVNRTGQPTGYKLIPGSNCLPFCLPEAKFQRRAGFLKHNLWVTSYKSDEIFRGGDRLSNQNRRIHEALATWVKISGTFVATCQLVLIFRFIFWFETLICSLMPSNILPISPIWSTSTNGTLTFRHLHIHFLRSLKSELYLMLKHIKLRTKGNFSLCPRGQRHTVRLSQWKEGMSRSLGE